MGEDRLCSNINSGQHAYMVEDYIDERHSELFLNGRFEEESPSQRFLEEYDDETLWDELAHRLSERDMCEAVDPVVLARMDVVERWAERDKYLERYFEEFEENGLDHLGIQSR